MAAYDAFIDDPSTVKDGVMQLAVRELDPEDRKRKYFTRYVEAEIKRVPEGKEPKGDSLRLRYNRGRLHKGVWEIKILKELGEFLPKVAKART